MKPVIGITCDTRAATPAGRWAYESRFEYADNVAAAGGLPLLLPAVIDDVADYIRLCDGFLLSGGDDIDTTPYGEPLHPAATVMHPRRQQFETMLLAALDHTAHPVLGICMGMQLMAVHAGGRLHQHIPDAPGITPEQAATHKSGDHGVRLIVNGHKILPQIGTVRSYHHQAVADPGSMRAIALSDEPAATHLIEAIESPDPRRFYLGVQWHAERTTEPAMGRDLIARFVHACKK